MNVYHGSYTEVSAPDVSFSRDRLDFGKGFYVTPIRNQALRWCEKFIRLRGIAFLNSYSMDDSLFVDTSLRIKKFDNYDEAWLDFVFECRMGHDIYKKYDIITGGVANDRIFATIDAYFSGYMSRDVALEKLKFERPNNQICFISQTVLSERLKFLLSEQIKK